MPGKTECKSPNNNTLELLPAKATNAVGVPDRHWFIAIVKANNERSTAEKIESLGFETYVPIQKTVKRNAEDTKVTRMRPLLSGKLFVRCTEQQRAELLSYHIFDRFLVNIAATPNKFNRRPVAIIPDSQMMQFRRMVDRSRSAIDINPADLKVGDEVIVAKGSLKGLRGRVATAADGKNRIVINLDFIGMAVTTIAADYIDPVLP